MAACALGKHRVLGMQLHAELEAVTWIAVLAHAHVAGGHALDRTVFIEQHLGSGEAGENLDTQRLGLLGHPAGDGAQAHDVVAVVMQAGGQQEVRGAE